MISLYFGSPGAGKTTLAASLVYRQIKENAISGYDRKVFSNFDCVGSYQITKDELGSVTPPPGSVILWDESGIDFNNRNYKSFPQRIIKYVKLHRHYKVDMIFLSQSWDDTDITIRRLAVMLANIKKVGPFTTIRRVVRYVHVDEIQHQILDGYKFVPIWMFWMKPIGCIFRPFYYHMFDSYQVDDPLPLIDERLWYDDKQPLPKLLAAVQLIRGFFERTILDPVWRRINIPKILKRIFKILVILFIYFVFSE